MIADNRSVSFTIVAAVGDRHQSQEKQTRSYHSKHSDPKLLFSSIQVPVDIGMTHI